jgi:hypothetical protein
LRRTASQKQSTLAGSLLNIVHFELFCRLKQFIDKLTPGDFFCHEVAVNFSFSALSAENEKFNISLRSLRLCGEKLLNPLYFLGITVDLSKSESAYYV